MRTRTLLGPMVFVVAIRALAQGGWPTSFGGGGHDDRGHDVERISSSPPGPKDLGHPPCVPTGLKGTASRLARLEALLEISNVASPVVGDDVNGSWTQKGEKP